LDNDIYVFPIVKENLTNVVISFPKNEHWIDYWNSKLYYAGGY